MRAPGDVLCLKRTTEASPVLAQRSTQGKPVTWRSPGGHMEVRSHGGHMEVRHGPVERQGHSWEGGRGTTRQECQGEGGTGRSSGRSAK